MWSVRSVKKTLIRAKPYDALTKNDNTHNNQCKVGHDVQNGDANSRGNASTAFFFFKYAYKARCCRFSRLVT